MRWQSAALFNAAIGRGIQPPPPAQLELATCLARGADIQRSL